MPDGDSVAWPVWERETGKRTGSFLDGSRFPSPPFL